MITLKEKRERIYRKILTREQDVKAHLDFELFLRLEGALQEVVRNMPHLCESHSGGQEEGPWTWACNAALSSLSIVQQTLGRSFDSDQPEATAMESVMDALIRAGLGVELRNRLIREATNGLDITTSDEEFFV